MAHRDAIEKRRHRAYVVALTGLASRRDGDEAESSGFDNFLTKPTFFRDDWGFVKTAECGEEGRGNHELWRLTGKWSGSVLWVGFMGLRGWEIAQSIKVFVTLSREACGH